VAGKADNLTAICEPAVYKMWEPRHLTTLWASMASYRHRFTFFFKLSAEKWYCLSLQCSACMTRLRNPFLQQENSSNERLFIPSNWMLSMMKIIGNRRGLQLN
jgi:hypothetical protein